MLQQVTLAIRAFIRIGVLETYISRRVELRGVSPLPTTPSRRRRVSSSLPLVARKDRSAESSGLRGGWSRQKASCDEPPPEWRGVNHDHSSSLSNRKKKHNRCATRPHRCDGHRAACEKHQGECDEQQRECHRQQRECGEHKNRCHRQQRECGEHKNRCHRQQRESAGTNALTAMYHIEGSSREA